MRHRSSNILSLVSLVLLALCIVLWIRSYRYHNGLSPMQWGERSYGVGMVRGAIFMGYGETMPIRMHPKFLNIKINHRIRFSEPSRQLLGFGYDSALLRIPLWFPAAILAVPPVWWLLRRRTSVAGRGFPVGE